MALTDFCGGNLLLDTVTLVEVINQYLVFETSWKERGQKR